MSDEAGTGLIDPAGEESAQDGAEFDYEALEEATAERLLKTFSGEEEADTDEDDDADEDVKDDDADEDESDDEAGDDLDDDEDEDESDDDTEAAASTDEDDDAPTLPDAYRRSLKAYNWSDEEIDKNLRHMGGMFIETASRIHANRNAELSAWAAKGREAKADTGQQQTQQASNQLPKFDADALKKKHGDDDLIDDLVGPLNTFVDTINGMLPAIQQTQQAAASHEEASLRKMVTEFFTSEKVAKPYAKAYGAGDASLTQEQILNRNQVLETADALIVGAQYQGRSLTLEEALQHAHDMVSAEFKVDAARSSIKKEAKARNRGISQRPTNRSGRVAGKNKAPQTRDELEKRTAERLAKTFGSR